jgi:heme/copper-type cytochrome/quinol oxidase subunit 2
MLTKENRAKSKEQRAKAVFGICIFFIGISAQAQCAMCRASLESTGNATQAEAVNDGIVYLMAIPYILVAVIGITIYRMFYKKPKLNSE